MIGPPLIIAVFAATVLFGIVGGLTMMVGGAIFVLFIFVCGRLLKQE
jgi:hypothetical protein